MRFLQPQGGPARINRFNPFGRRVNIACVPMDGNLWEAASGRLIAPSASLTQLVSTIGASLAGTGVFTVPTSLFKLDKDWTLFFLFRDRSYNAGAIKTLFSNAGYNSGNGDQLQIGSPDYTGYPRFKIFSLGSYGGTNGGNTTNP